MAAVVLTGTTYPLFAELLFGAKISVGKPFFDSAVLPLCAPLFFAMAIGPVLSWKRAALEPALTRLWWAALIALAVWVLASLGPARGIPALAYAGAAWLIAGSIAEIVERIRLFRIPLSASLSRLAGQPRAVWGAAIAHAGMGVTVIGIAGMSLAVSAVVAVKPGGGTELGGYTWTLRDLRDGRGSNFNARVADLVVSRDGKVIAAIHPSRKSFVTQRQTIADSAIVTDGFRDLYAVLGEERDGSAILRLHVNPLAPEIWLGALVMAAGGMVSLADRRLRIGAPARRAAAPAAVRA